ncbi:MAG: TetR family transcriptional regulator [Pseudomonadota bacterium]
MARRTKEDAEKTREALLDAAERVFIRDGVAAATLEDIAREAGVTRGAVYWHFDNKQDVFSAMHNRVKLPMDMLYQRMVSGDDPLGGLQAVCTEVLQMIATTPRAQNVYTVLFLRCEQMNCNTSSYKKEIAEKRLEVIAKFQKVFAKAAREKKLAPGVTASFAASALHSWFIGILMDYLRNQATYPLAKLAPKLTATFFRGVLR